MSFSDLLSDFMSRLFSIVPRLAMIAETQGGVAWVRGKARAIKSGCIFFYWPLWTELDILQTHRDTITIEGQVIQEKAISCVVVYKINDAAKAIKTLGMEVENAVSDITGGAVSASLVGRDCKYIEAHTEALNNELKDRVGRELRKYGVSVHDIYISEFAPCQTIRVMGIDILTGEE